MLSDGVGLMPVWQRAERVLWRLVLDDLVVLGADSDAEPFALAGGRRLWEALGDAGRLDQIAARMGAGPSPPELLALLESLSDRGVVTRSEP